jgi:transcriptional regulator with XRE-family HTH domain
LDEAQVKKIKQRLARGDKASQVAKDFGVTKTTISSIAHGHSWSHVEVEGDLIGDTSGERHWNSRLTQKKVRKIRELLAKGKTLSDVAQRFGVSAGTISDIKHGRTWREK